MELRALSRLVPGPEKFLAEPPDRPEAWSIPDDSVLDLLALAELDQIMANGLIPSRHIRIIDKNGPLPAERYVWGQTVSQRGFRGDLRSYSVNRLVGAGATLAVNDLERVWEPVGDLCRRLILESGQGVAAAAFLTPATSVGLTAHYDTESVLLVQVHGSKVWQVREPSKPYPLPHEPHFPLNAEALERLAGQPAFLEVTLRPGDALWIPRGWLHAATTTDESSLHVTYGFTPYTRYWLANRIVRGLDERLADFSAFRADLPWGVAEDPERLEAEIAETVEQLLVALGRLDPAEVSARVREAMRERYLSPWRSQPISTAIGSGADLDTRVVMVTEAVNGISRLADGRLRMDLRDTALTVPAVASDEIETRWAQDSTEPWSARDLTPELGEDAAVVLVSSMLRAGVARTV